MPNRAPTSNGVQLEVLTPSSCDGCGLCCTNIGSPVLWYASSYQTAEGHPFRPDGLPPELIEEIDGKLGGLLRGQEPQARCLWFDETSRRCRHYEWRPQVCREYELGGRACRELRRPYVSQNGTPVDS